MPPPKQPSYRWILFGDGEFALELDKLYKKNEDGVEGWEFTMQPSKEIIDKFNLRENNQLDRFDHCKRWYSRSYVNALNDSPVRGRIFVQTDFEGNDTHFSRSLSQYTETINNLMRLINVLRAQNARTNRELTLLSTIDGQYWSEIVERIKKIKEISTTKSPFDQAMMEGTQDTQQQ